MDFRIFSELNSKADFLAEKFMIEINGRKFIVVCDDFGISERANKNILELVKLGKIDRVAVMMGANMSPEEVQLLLASGVKLDIHLHLNNGGSCCDRRGAVRRSISFLRSYFFGERGSKKVAIEWQNQIGEFQSSFGRNPDGLNSHEHMHFFPPYFKIAVGISKKLALPYFRFGEKGIKGNNSTGRILQLLRIIDKKVFKKYSLLSSDYMESFDWISDLKLLNKKFPPGSTVELIFHPERKEEFEFLRKQ